MDNALQLPDYELLQCIGQGGFGVVYLARARTKVLRAVKIVRCDHEGYDREVEAIEQYEHIRHNHPALLRILHVGMGEGFYYYVMPLADSIDSSDPIDVDHYKSKTLSAVMERSRPLPLRQCVETTIQLLEGVDVLHRADKVHRDIKPANILYFDGLPVLGDMGLLTQAGPDVSRCGTRGYEAPEGPGRPPADLYAMGMLLYHMSTGMRPADFPNLPSASLMPEEIGFGEVNKIILRACEENPARRYPDAESMIADLRRLLRPTEATRKAPKQKTAPRTRAKKPAADEATSMASLTERLSSAIEVELKKVRHGYPGNQQYLTCPEIRRITRALRTRARELFDGQIPLVISAGCKHAEAVLEHNPKRRLDLLVSAFSAGGDGVVGGAKAWAVARFNAVKYARLQADPDRATRTALNVLGKAVLEAVEDTWEDDDE